MASFRNRGDAWRVEIHVGGVRESASFKEKFEAQTWASIREAELKALKRAADNARRLATNRHRFLQCSGLYSEAEIVGTSTPIPKTSGVYFLIKANSVVYVGQSIDVRSRISKHISSKSFDRINVIECPTKDLTKLEKQYIKKFDPILNIMGKVGLDEMDLMMSAECQAY